MDEDLPLLANVADIFVRHYNFTFTCDFKKKCFDCCVILFLEPVLSRVTQTCHCSTSLFTDSLPKDVSLSLATKRSSEISHCKNPSDGPNFELILDCHKIIVKDVSVVNVSDEKFHDAMKFVGFNASLADTNNNMQFLINDWSLKIWTEYKSCKVCFPKVIKISYATIPSSPSLLWVRDQDRKPVVFTYGAAVNNRALFPCQEPPIAMATWEAFVIVPDSAVALMSGDEEPVISHCKDSTQFYYFTKKALPLSTLCLAIGFWEEHVISQRYVSSPKCRIFAPSSLMDISVLELFEYVPYCLKISEDTFGSYPFSRIDFLIVPPTFGSLGMASPNIIFLSQSLLVGDGSMCSRVSHEIAHGWFGLLIGALDWSEEWLSEGFATFAEDYIHPFTMNGYFLLKYLSDIVGIESFFKFLNAYIMKYGGHLVTSAEFLTMYLSYFPSTKDEITLKSIYDNWLNNPGLPDVLTISTISDQNKLFEEASNQTEEWVKLNNVFLKKQLKKNKKLNLDQFSSMTGDQIILLLENLLEIDVLKTQTLKFLDDVYKFKKLNPEIQHRWFELVVKFKFKREYSALRKFLIDHMAMGVYLYGEMIISENSSLKNIAQECYDALQSEMEPNYRTTVAQMLQTSAS